MLSRLEAEDKELGISPPSIHSTLPVPMHFLSLLERRQSTGRRVRGETLANVRQPAAIFTTVCFPHFGIEAPVCEWESVTHPGNDHDPGRGGKLVGQQGRSRDFSDLFSDRQPLLLFHPVGHHDPPTRPSPNPDHS